MGLQRMGSIKTAWNLFKIRVSDVMNHSGCTLQKPVTHKKVSNGLLGNVLFSKKSGNIK